MRSFVDRRMGSGGPESEKMNRKKSPVGWFPRGKSESYLERKIRLLQESQGMKASLDETLASSRHLSRIEREKQAARTAGQEATETRKIALIEASWCRILKAARIACTSAAVELQKAEKKAVEAFNRAAALGVVLKSSAGDLQAEFTPRTPSRHKITASLDTAFGVDEEVAAALKFALQLVSNVSCSVDGDEAGNSSSDEAGAKHDEGQENDGDNPGGQEINSGLNALMLERVRSLEPEQRESLASLVATRGLNALLREESHEQELNSRSWNGGGLGEVLVKHVSRLEAEKKEAPKEEAMARRAPRIKAPADVPDLRSVLVKKHVSRIEREKQQARAIAQAELENSAADAQDGELQNAVQGGVAMSREPLVERKVSENEGPVKGRGGEWPVLDELLQPVKKASRLEMEKRAFAEEGIASNASHRRSHSRDLEVASAWGGLDLGNSLKRHVSKLEAEQAAWRRAAEDARNKV